MNNYSASKNNGSTTAPAAGSFACNSSLIIVILGTVLAVSFVLRSLLIKLLVVLSIVSVLILIIRILTRSDYNNLLAEQV